MKTDSYSMSYSKEDVWRSSTYLKILSFFLERPKQEFYSSEVSEKVGVSSGAANEKLKELYSAGFLEKRKEGRMYFYSLKKDDEAVKQLKVARNLSKPLVEGLKKVGGELGLEVYLYGSVARGEDRQDSDWDVLFIGSASSADLQRKVDEIDSSLDISTSLFTRSEWNQTEEEDPAFYERVERDRIRLI